jgi:hypothetical protein
MDIGMDVPEARRLDGIRLTVAFDSASEGKEEGKKEILEWCLNSILLVPPANLSICQELQHRFRQPFVLEPIHHLQSPPMLVPSLLPPPFIPCALFNPRFEGKTIPLAFAIPDRLPGAAGWNECTIMTETNHMRTQRVTFSCRSLLSSLCMGGKGSSE